MTLLHSCYNWYPLCHWALSLVLPSLGCHFRDAGMCEKSDPVIYKHHPSRSSAAEKQRVKNKKHVWTLRENTVKSSSYCTLGFLVSFLGFRWGRFIDSFPAGTWDLSHSSYKSADTAGEEARWLVGDKQINVSSVKRNSLKSRPWRQIWVCTLHSHLALWHGQVEVVEDLQFAVRPAHISALDRKVLPSSRQSGLQVSLHVPVLQLQERKYRKKHQQRSWRLSQSSHQNKIWAFTFVQPTDTFTSLHVNISMIRCFFCSFHGYFDETSEGLPSMFSGDDTEHHDGTSGHFPTVLFSNRTKQNHFLTQVVFVPYLPQIISTEYRKVHRRHWFCRLLRKTFRVQMCLQREGRESSTTQDPKYYFHQQIHLFQRCNHAVFF